MDGCYLDFYSPCEQCGKCGWVEKYHEEEPQEESKEESED